ncbi:MAG TPA: DUF429 domain-containing protein [Polyangia bacterium]|nr:DUF429 domain-containing protein [Polyangia bacterium]
MVSQTYGRRAAKSKVDGLASIPHAETTVNGRNFTHILGVDLGGGKGKKTAFATLRVEAAGGATVVEIAPRAGGLPLYDGALVEAIRRVEGAPLLCIDAPLTLPPCLRCAVPVCPGQSACVDPAVLEMRRLAAGDPDDPNVIHVRADRDERRGKPSVTPYTQRPTEVFWATRLGIVPREALGQGTGPLAARAAYVTRALADRFTLNHNLLEVYPKGTLHALGFARPYKKHLHERETRAAILEALSTELHFGPGVWREVCIQSDHLFEAVICAFTGYLWARDAWTAPAPDGVDRAEGVSHHRPDGWIWIPPVTADDVSEPTAAEG